MTTLLAPVADIDRRRFIIGVGAAALGVTGCGDDDAPTSGATRVVDTAKGPVTIPTQPQRIVCVDGVSSSVMLELGLTPVGVPERLETTVALGHIGDLDPIDKVADLNEGPRLEKVTAARPDLILGASDSITPYESLRGIAPTVLFDQNKIEEWPKQSAQYADVVGLVAQNEALRKRYEARAASIKSRYQDLLAKTRWAIIFGIGDGLVWLYYPNSQAGTVLSAAGARFTASMDGRQGNFDEVSVENLDLIADADAIAVYAENDGSMQEFQRDNLLEIPTFKRLPAVQAGHVFPFARLYPQSYGGALDELDEFERALMQLA